MTFAKPEPEEWTGLALETAEAAEAKVWRQTHACLRESQASVTAAPCGGQKGDARQPGAGPYTALRASVRLLTLGVSRVRSKCSATSWDVHTQT